MSNEKDRIIRQIREVYGMKVTPSEAAAIHGMLIDAIGPRRQFSASELLAAYRKGTLYSPTREPGADDG